MFDSIFSQNKEIILSLIAANGEIGIVIGEELNLDKVSAALSLYLSLTLAGKNAQVVSSSDPIVEYSSLVGVNKLRKNFDGVVKTFIISLPYSAPYKEEIEKVSYTIEQDRLNVNIIAGEKGISFSEKEVSFEKKGLIPSLVFTIGAPDVSGVSKFLDNSNIKIVNIDNLPNNSFYGDAILVSAAFSSYSEIIAKMIKDFSLPVDLDIAQNLLSGIVFSTRNFTSLGTSAFAFEAAAYLLEAGAKRKNLGNNFENTVISGKTSFEKTPEAKKIDKTEGNKEIKDNKPGNTDTVPEDWFVPKIFKGSSDSK